MTPGALTSTRSSWPRGWRRLSRRSGGRIYEQTRALAYETLPEGYRVHTAYGDVRADVLLLACNAYLDTLDESLSRRVLPVGSYQVATKHSTHNWRVRCCRRTAA